MRKKTDAIEYSGSQDGAFSFMVGQDMLASLLLEYNPRPGKLADAGMWGEIAAQAWKAIVDAARDADRMPKPGMCVLWDFDRRDAELLAAMAFWEPAEGRFYVHEAPMVEALAHYGLKGFEDGLGLVGGFFSWSQETGWPELSGVRQAGR